MLNEIYTLPEIRFIGGETQTLVFDLYTLSGDPYKNIDECEINFSIIHHANRDYSEPVFTLTDASSYITTGTGTEGYYNKLTIELLPTHTAVLSGKYIYQLSITDTSQNVEICQGVMLIIRNINSGVLSG